MFEAGEKYEKLVIVIEGTATQNGKDIAVKGGIIGDDALMEDKRSQMYRNSLFLASRTL